MYIETCSQLISVVVFVQRTRLYVIADVSFPTKQTQRTRRQQLQ